MIRIRPHHPALVGLSLLAGCGPATSDDGANSASPDQVAAARERITNGVPANTVDLPVLDVVSITTRRPMTGGRFMISHCSGVLLSNRWVLTAGHCLCQYHASNPSQVKVTVYGSEAKAASQPLAALYETTAAKIVENPSYDVALIQLSQTLPLYEPPFIYKGNGSGLSGATATAWGFGLQSFDSNGQLTGDDQRLNWLVTKIDHNASLGASIHDIGEDENPCNPTEATLQSTGPFTGPLTPGGPQTQEGDSGGPLFLETPSAIPDVNQHQLVGILRGLSPPDGNNRLFNAYTGIWLIRDWIRTTAPDLAPRSVCPATIPDSVGATAPAVAEGPEGAIHIVAIQSNGVLGHWRFQNGSLFKAGTIAGTLTSHAPAMGLEPQVVGVPKMMGLAYRDRNTGTLKYVRWSGATWSAPIDVPGSATPAGPAMANGGAIAYITAGNRVAATAYQPQSNSFFPAQLVPAGAPTADPAKRLSIVEDLTSGFAEVGYRTTANEWVQAFGSSNCVSLTGSFWCNPDPKYGTDWASASLAWAPGQRVGLVTTRLVKPTDSSFSLENRVISGPASFTWGHNRMFIPQEPGVAQIGFDTWLATATANNGLTLAHTDNCFANDW